MSYIHNDPAYAARLEEFRDHCDADEAGEIDDLFSDEAFDGDDE